MAENKLFRINQKEWIKYYETFLDIKWALIEQEGGPDGEYDVSHLIIQCFHNPKKPIEENRELVKKIISLIFGIREKFEKPSESYVNVIKSIFPKSKENQARLFFLIDEAVNSHIPID